MDNEAPFIVLGVWGVVAGFGWIVWVIATNVRIARVSRSHGSTQTDLVEKLASSQELMGFLQTEAGQRLFAEAPKIERRKNPIDRILTSVQTGIVFAAIGAALAGLSMIVPLASSTFIAFGSLAGALGCGLMLSAFVSYRISKSMELIERTNDRADS